MSDDNLDYAAIGRYVDKKIGRQKWLYRLIFFAMHFIFFAVTMVIVWGILATNPPLRATLFDSGAGAAMIVILPTILWGMAIFFHIASLFFESGAGENALRQQLLAREIAEKMMRSGTLDEKPKRRASGLASDHVQLSDDGELLPADEDEHVEQRGYKARTNSAGSS